MITAFGDVGSYLESMDLGACEYVNKPFETTELLGMLLQRRHARLNVRIPAGRGRRARRPAARLQRHQLAEKRVDLRQRQRQALRQFAEESADDTPSRPPWGCARRVCSTAASTSPNRGSARKASSRARTAPRFLAAALTSRTASAGLLVNTTSRARCVKGQVAAGNPRTGRSQARGFGRAASPDPKNSPGLSGNAPRPAPRIRGDQFDLAVEQIDRPESELAPAAMNSPRRRPRGRRCDTGARSRSAGAGGSGRSNP